MKAEHYDLLVLGYCYAACLYMFSCGIDHKVPPDFKEQREQFQCSQQKCQQKQQMSSIQKHVSRINTNPAKHDPVRSIASRSAILLVTYMRSGSTFLGEVFNQNPNVFYWFEPLAAVYDKLYPGKNIRCKDTFCTLFHKNTTLM